MQKAQTISSLVLSLRKRLRSSTFAKVMIPVLDEKQRLEIEAVLTL
jgi:isoleucyl-tRNA synthetase